MQINNKTYTIGCHYFGPTFENRNSAPISSCHLTKMIGLCRNFHSGPTQEGAEPIQSYGVEQLYPPPHNSILQRHMGHQIDQHSFLHQLMISLIILDNSRGSRWWWLTPLCQLWRRNCLCGLIHIINWCRIACWSIFESWTKTRPLYCTPNCPTQMPATLINTLFGLTKTL